MSEYRSTIEKAFRKLYAEFSSVRSDSKIASIVGRGASGDITHVIDAMAEKILIESFRKEMPDCTIVSEEIGIVKGKNDAPIVLMDPIDGSTNAVRGLPVFCATAGILEDRSFGSMEASGTIDLVTGEVIVGDEDGTYVNGTKATLSKVSRLQDAIVSYEVKVRVERPKKMISKMYELITKTKYPRVLGSAALEIAYVAIGRMDAYVAPGNQLRSYDCLPSIFLVKSAGGFVEGIGQNTDSVDVMSRERVSFVVAGNRTLGKILAKEFSSL
ncbi:MAG: inositol monophosphatase [Thaumarchaeota archaeon]|nr:inositol monophosphatase [Nitrososphaerota archaeon]